MDLKEFYFQNIKESEYHHRFLNSVKKVNYTVKGREKLWGSHTIIRKLSILNRRLSLFMA